MRHDQTKYPRDLDDMVGWVLGSVPVGGRVLEIGSGDGAVIGRLRARGVDAIGVDPHGQTGQGLNVLTVEEFDAEPFDVIFSSVALHHLRDRTAVIDALRRLSKPGTQMLVREFDVDLVRHEPTLRWWYRMRQAVEVVTPADKDDHPLAPTFEEFFEWWSAMMSHHVVAWDVVRAMLGDSGFGEDACAPMPYLFRWGLHEGVRPFEEALIAEGRINQVGIRWSGRRA